MKMIKTSAFHTCLLASVCASAIMLASKAAHADNLNGTLFTPPASTPLFAEPKDLSKPPSEASNNATVIGTGDNSALAPQESKLDTLRYELLLARLDLETGHIYAATKRLNALMPEYKDNPEFLGFLANAENYGGNWEQAEALLKDAHAMAPENQDVNDLLRDVRREHAQNVEYDFDWIKYGSSDEFLSQLSGYVDVTNHFLLGATVEDNYVEGKDLRLSNGFVGDTNTNKLQENVYGTYYTTNGQRVQGEVFSNNDTAGLGAYYGFLSPLGQTDLTGEYQRPYWDLPEGIFDDANRDRIAFLQTIKPSTSWTVNFGGGWNRYNVEQVDDVMTTISANGNIVYNVFQEVAYHKPSLNLGYSLDAEYVRTANESLDDTGTITRTFPLVSREIHTLFAETNYDFTPTTYGEATAGWEYDRLGGNGPTISGKITHEITPAFDVQLRAGYGLQSTNTQDTIADVGGYLRWRF